MVIQALIKEPVFSRLAQKYGKSNAQIILRWHIQAGNVVIPGSKNPDHIRANFDLFDFALDDAEMAENGAKYGKTAAQAALRWIWGTVRLSICGGNCKVAEWLEDSRLTRKWMYAIKINSVVTIDSTMNRIYNNLQKRGRDYADFKQIYIGSTHYHMH